MIRRWVISLEDKITLSVYHKRGMKNMNKLHALRKSRGVTLEQISDETDISVSSLSRYEKGERNPKINTIRTLAEYFGVSSDYLEGRVNSEFDIENVGEIIRQLRRANKISQTKLSKILNIGGNSTMSQYETNKRTPNIKELNRILNYFGKQLKVVDIDDKEI